MSCMSKLEDKLMFMGYKQSYDRYRLFKLSSGLLGFNFEGCSILT